MNKKIWRVSLSGQRLIQEAKNQKGWKISEDDPRPLQEASRFLLIQYAKTNNIKENDRMRWRRDFDLIFGRKKTANKKAIEEIKQQLIRSQENSCLKILDKLIEEEEIYPTGISYGTWKRFASQSKREAILENAFKAYCHILELDWQEIIEPEAECKAIAKAIQTTQEELKTISLVPFVPRQNLPTPEQCQFIGREEQIQLFLKWLGDDRIHRISVEGIGGAGKTSFVLEAAYRCLRSAVGKFEAIIFTSAKQQRLKTRQILSRLQRERTLDDILTAIAKTLNDPDILAPDKQRRLERVINSLKAIKTLLILDNLETYDDIESIVAFIYELPSTVKVIITSREQVLLEDFQTISLSSLSEEEAIALIKSHLQDKALQLNLQQSQLLYRKTGGIPAAIVYAIGQLKAGYALESILPQMTLATADFARFYFAGSLNTLKEQPAYKLLMALVVFPQGAMKDAIATIAGISDSMEVEMGFARLKQLSLVQCQKQHYSLLPLTRSYVLAALQANSHLETEIRDRWVYYYTSSLKKSGEQNSENESERLELEWENIREIMEWCIEQEHYSDFYQLWHYIKDYTQFRGYWQERFVWMDWLIEAAQKRQDWQATAESMLDKGKTLLLLGQPQQYQEAIALLERAWTLSQDDSSQLHLCEVAIDLAISYMQQSSFKEAHLWLDRGEKLLKQNLLEISNYNFLKVKLFYYRAEIFFRQKNYERAKAFYSRSLELAKSFNWERGIIYNKLSLAIVAIEQQQNLVWARRVLKENTKLVHKDRDKRCLAFCKRAFALLEKASGNATKASEWALSAKANFSGLGMKQQAREMQLWIEQWTEVEKMFNNQ
jgi:hypothetical protein